MASTPVRAAGKSSASKQKSVLAISLPPSADLHYSIKARRSGLTLDGEALVQWQTSGSRFTIDTESRAMLAGKIAAARSEGNIDSLGLVPLTFTEKRFRKNPTTTTFDRVTNTINFGGSGNSTPLKGGEQDRNSAIWQLISLARGGAAKVKPGMEWTFMVAGAKDAEAWTFQVLEQEKMSTAFGQLGTLHIIRKPPPDSNGSQLDIWLAPSQEWYPVRLRFAEADGDTIEQQLEKISKK